MGITVFLILTVPSEWKDLSSRAFEYTTEGREFRCSLETNGDRLPMIQASGMRETALSREEDRGKRAGTRVRERERTLE